jgi:anti-anti-sigma factor
VPTVKADFVSAGLALVDGLARTRGHYRGAMPLRHTLSLVAGRPVVALNGSVDLATVPSLHNALATAILDHPATIIAVDLHGVDAFDDVALGVLLGAAGRARRGGGDLFVVTTDDAVRQRFALTGFDRAVTVASSLSA